MEKTSIKFSRKLCLGLLTFILSNIAVFALPPSPSQIRELVVTKDTEVFFTAQMNGFTLKIPGIEPSKVQTDLPLLPSGVKFVSSKKEEFIEQDSSLANQASSVRGTVVHLWFTFTDTGNIKLPPLITRINNRTYYLPFEDVTVYENPNLIEPKLSVIFADESRIVTDKKTSQRTYRAKAGEEIRFRVYIQYFVQILSFSWELPKNSIFREERRWKIATIDSRNIQTQKTEFTPESFPVAEFVWKPLIEGNYDIPRIYAEAIAYNGSKKTVFVPDFPFLIEAAPKKDAVQTSTDLQDDFSTAFSKPIEENTALPQYAPTQEDLRHLADLRTKERHSFFNGKIREERKNFELSIGLLPDENEKRFFLFKMVSPSYGIFAGGNVNTIPEEKSASHNLTGGQRVKITEKAGEWYYIECKIFSGWVKSEQIFRIN